MPNSEIKYTLIGDGSSDKTLLQIVQWLVSDLYPNIIFNGQFVDSSDKPNIPKHAEIAKRFHYADTYFPFDVLIYHRDAELNQPNIITQRKNEIESQLTIEQVSKVICIVPVTMMESWLMFDIEAIKKASGNRNPNHRTLQQLKRIRNSPQSNSKKNLHEQLTTASELKGRRLNNFDVNNAVHLVAEYISDYSPLRRESSFNEFEKDLKFAIDSIISKLENVSKNN